MTATKACLLVLAGGFAAQHNRLPLDSDHCSALFVAAILILAVRRIRWFALLVLGFALFTHAGNKVINARLQPRFAGDSMLASVRIADLPRVTGTSVSMLVEPLGDPRIPARSRVSWYDPPRIPAIGEVWELELRLRPPRGNSNPGVFSLENWMFREKLHAAGYVVPGKRNQLLQAASLPGIEAYRRDFVERAERLGGESAPVLAAIGVGARHLITRQQWDRYARTGSSHLMAISGLHIGLAAMAAFLCIAPLLGGCRLPGNHLDHATVGSATLASVYAIISGFAVPSQRATVMLGLAAVAFLSRRRARPGRIVALVGLLVFIVDPLSMLMPGFYLSFAAVLVLLWLARSYSRPLPGASFRKLAQMQVWLLLGLLPLTVLIFHRIAIVAPLVNLIVVPVFSLVTVPLTLASMLMEPLWAELGNVMLRFAAKSAVEVERIIGLFADLPVADIIVAGVDGSVSAVCCFLFLPALWLLLPRGWPGRWIAALGVTALLSYKPGTPPEACVDTDVLDVGQGLAVVIQSRRHTLVFDTGKSYRGGGSAAEQVVLPFLRYKGIGSIDWLVVSHADDDHAGGLPALAHHLSIGKIFAGEPLPEVGLTVSTCSEGQNWRVDGIEFRFLHPAAGNLMTGNDSSCVLVASAGSKRLVLTGDIERAGEREVLSNLSFEKASAVVIPHHGSLTSSSPAFVNRLRPDLAIASAAYENRWGFPKESVTDRWAGAGAAVLDTASSGAVSFRLCAGDGISRLREERFRRQRFWHDSAKL